VKNQQSVQYTHRGNFYAALQRPLENALLCVHFVAISPNW